MRARPLCAGDAAYKDTHRMAWQRCLPAAVVVVVVVVATGVVCGIGRHAGRAARGLCQVSPLAVAGLSGMKT
eukprot:COSAG01_NODE_11446_length_1931_cov_0.859170_3_plen_72_part_00